MAGTAQAIPAAPTTQDRARFAAERAATDPSSGCGPGFTAALRRRVSPCYLPQPVIDLHVNGEARTVPTGTTVQTLLVTLGLQAAHVAVERNGVIVSRDERAHIALQDGDTLEIVTFVGGG